MVISQQPKVIIPGMNQDPIIINVDTKISSKRQIAKNNGKSDLIEKGSYDQYSSANKKRGV